MFSLESYKDALWTAWHANELSRFYKWDAKKAFPSFILHPVEYWYAWAMIAFGLICAVYIPFFWIVYSLFIAFLMFHISLGVVLHFPRNRNALICRHFTVYYKDDSKRTVELWIPRYAAQYIGDPFLFDSIDSLENSKVKYCHGIEPSFTARYI